MRRSSVFALLSFLSITGASEASGQLCAGTAPFSSGPVRLAGTYQFVNDQKTYGGAVALGATNGAFGGAYLSTTVIEGLDESPTNYGGHVGFAVPVDQGKKVELCPTVTVDMVSAELDFGPGVAKFSGTRVGLGFGIGGTVSAAPNFDFVPFASVAYNHATAKATFAGTTDKTSDDLGILTLGAGLVLNKIFTLQPNVAIPFGVDDGDPVYGLTVAINIGRKK